MPAAAVIPAPVAYIKVVAVKMFVVVILFDTCCLQQWRIYTLLMTGAYFEELRALERIVFIAA